MKKEAKHHHEKMLHHLEKALHHHEKSVHAHSKHESKKEAKMHEAAAGRKYNKSEKHREAERRGAKKK